MRALTLGPVPQPFKNCAFLVSRYLSVGHDDYDFGFRQLRTYSMPRTSSLVAFLTPWIPLAVHALHNFQDKCLSFTPEASIYNSSRHVLAYVAAGTNLSLPDNDPTCAQASQLVSVNICRVALSIPTTNRSSISFELWLPEDWSHRFLVTGNGGIDGCELCFVLERED